MRWVRKDGEQLRQWYMFSRQEGLGIGSDAYLRLIDDNYCKC